MFVITSCYSKEPEKTGLEGNSMPEFKLLLVDSTSYLDTKEIVPGKPVILLFYGPHCPYSRHQVEEIISNIDNLKDFQLYVITNWPFADMKMFYNHYHLHRYSNIIAGFDYSNYFPNYFGVKGVPYIAIYGKDKKLNKAFAGFTNIGLIKKAGFQ